MVRRILSIDAAGRQRWSVYGDGHPVDVLIGAKERPMG